MVTVPTQRLAASASLEGLVVGYETSGYRTRLTGLRGSPHVKVRAGSNLSLLLLWQGMIHTLFS